VELSGVAVKKLTHKRFRTVCECRVRGRPGKFAVKLIHSPTPAAMAGLQRELEFLRRVSHPNIVSLVGVATLPDAGLGMVMELYHSSLSQVMKR
jgi:serine/threonine protein kinase